MALKDLLASKASLAEDVIEQIISDYVRYDPDHKEVVFTPDAYGLSNKSKLLVYLVALQGWPYVLDEVVPVEAKPSEIEKQTGIAGGSLRPLLKELKDRNIIVEKGGRYSVRSVALRAIQVELDGRNAGSMPNRSKPKSAKSKDKAAVDVASDAVTEDVGTKLPSKKKRARANASGIGERFQAWIDEGYFDDAKTLSDVQARFHKEAIIVPQTSLPTYLLKAVRSGQLERDKQVVNGKTVWVYSRRR